VVVEDPFIEQTTQIVIEESFKEDSSPIQLKNTYEYCKEEVSTSLYNKYGLTLAPAVVVPLKEEI